MSRRRPAALSARRALALIGHAWLTVGLVSVIAYVEVDTGCFLASLSHHVTYEHAH